MYESEIEEFVLNYHTPIEKNPHINLTKQYATGYPSIRIMRKQCALAYTSIRIMTKQCALVYTSTNNDNTSLKSSTKLSTIVSSRS